MSTDVIIDPSSLPVSVSVPNPLPVSFTTPYPVTVNPPARQAVAVAWEDQTGTAAAESALANFTVGTRNFANQVPASIWTVAIGKTLRITAIWAELEQTSTVLNTSFVRLRVAASGVANTSPIAWEVKQAIEAATAAAGEGEINIFPIPDGLEVPATFQVTMTHKETAITCKVSYGFIGYEY